VAEVVDREHPRPIACQRVEGTCGTSLSMRRVWGGGDADDLAAKTEITHFRHPADMTKSGSSWAGRLSGHTNGLPSGPRFCDPCGKVF